ncbi:MAG: DUF502 domain-containing protein [Sedimentisphaerales bacterium]|nr:DUF502 domain-containing protein [Sedimentisphaerales bacterium]
MKNKILSKIYSNANTRLLSGMLLFIPFGVILLIIHWLFTWVASMVRPLINFLMKILIRIPFINALPDTLTTIYVVILTIIILLLIVYLIGWIGQRVIGKKLLHITEKLVQKIPLVRSIYIATKQVLHSISMPGQTAFKSVVLIEFPTPGMKAMGFVTGYIHDLSGNKYCKVLIPTTPNPTTGFFEIVPVEKVIETNLSIEEAFRIIISGGIVAPDVLNISPKYMKV